jgi:hypothetical protein
MHFKRSIRSFPESYALLSGQESADTAVFFVHGFIGNAVGTWVDFQGLIDRDPEHSAWWATSDLYFYGYKSKSAHVPVEAARFRGFLKDFYPSPTEQARAELCVPSLTLTGLRADEPLTPLPLAASYSRLVLIGHSLGGVIIRQAVVDEAMTADNARPSSMTGKSPLSAAVRLFAPAMYGFDPTHFGGYCYNLISELPLLQKFLKPVLRANPPHQDLSPESHLLKELRRRTELLASKHPSMNALRAHLMFGTEEHIVRMDRYDCDPVFRVVEGQDHSSVCKPTPHYRLPLEFISYELSSPAAV